MFGGIIKTEKISFHYGTIVLFILVVFIVFFSFPHTVFAETVFVDGDLAEDCAGSYSAADRACSGSDGNAYKSVEEGVSGAEAGDTINIREGEYIIDTPINIDFSSSSTTTIQAYNQENVTLHRPQVSGAIFNLASDSTENVLFKDTRFTSNTYEVITGWTNHSENIWSAPVAYTTTQVRFDTINGTSVTSLEQVDSQNKYHFSSGNIYVYSTEDPTTAYISPGINLADNFSGIAIGNPSRSAEGNLITIDNCQFDSFSHAAIKGTWRFHVKNSRFENIGTDHNDHHIYPPGVQAVGNEMIFEYNYFGYTAGAALNFYPSPAHAIVRYNIFNGLSDQKRGSWGILAGGSNIAVYNNTIYGWLNGLAFWKDKSQNNVAKNNIFSDNNTDITVDYLPDKYPIDNVVEANYLGSSTKCTGCVDRTGSGGPDYTGLAAAPPNYHSTSPWTQFSYSFNRSTSGSVPISFFNACGGGASPTQGAWYLDDISIVPEGGGPEKITNGGMEAEFTNGIAQNWLKGGSNSMYSEETAVVHSGVSAQKIILAGGCGERLYQNVSLDAGDYVLTGWAKRDSGTGTLPVYIGGVNTSFTIGRMGPSFLGDLPYSEATDFKIDPSEEDVTWLIDSGVDLGKNHQTGFNSAATGWPISSFIDQEFFGGGWDLGSFIYNTDITAPTTTADTAAKWVDGGVTVTLTCDDFSGVGCANTYYTRDGSIPSLSSATGTSIFFANDGTHTLKYFSVDYAGNQEEVKTDEIVVVSPPVPKTTSTASPRDCSATKPHEVPDLFQINGKVSGVTLYFSPVKDNFDRYFVSYGITPEAEQYGFELVNDDKGVISVDVLALNPAIPYYFKVRAGNGCMPGDWSNILGARSGQRLPSYRWGSVAQKISQPFAETSQTNQRREVSFTPTTESPLPQRSPAPQSELEALSQPTSLPDSFLPSRSQTPQSQSFWENVTGFLTGWLR